MIAIEAYEVVISVIAIISATILSLAERLSAENWLIVVLPILGYWFGNMRGIRKRGSGPSS